MKPAFNSSMANWATLNCKTIVPKMTSLLKVPKVMLLTIQIVTRMIILLHHNIIMTFLSVPQDNSKTNNTPSG